MIALRCQDLFCNRPEWTYGPSRLDGVSLALEAGRLHGVRGEPRSGKTLLMHVLGLIEPRDAGDIELFGAPVEAEADSAILRNSIFGYLFPSPCLLPAFTVAENVAMPLFRFGPIEPGAARERVTSTLAEIGIAHLTGAVADHLSTEEQHLVSLARAIIHRPRILIAINPGCADVLLPLVTDRIRQRGMTCLWSTRHSDAPLPSCDHEITLEHGHVTAPAEP